MTQLLDLNLIRLFDFYLAAAFLISTYVRFQQYETIVRLVRAVPDRWPKLMNLVKQHHGIFLTGATILPAALALGLSAVHMLACRLIWPHARLTALEVSESAVPMVVMLIFGAAMLGIYLYATFSVGKLDRALLEKYFDQAEYWLRSWVAPVIHFFTLGYVNPRKMVAVEVRNALEQTSRLLNSTLWWVTAQVSFRIAFGLSLWLTWAIRGS